MLLDLQFAIYVSRDSQRLVVKKSSFFPDACCTGLKIAPLVRMFQYMTSVILMLLGELKLAMILAWFVGMGCYMLSFFSTFLAIPFSASGSEFDPTVSPFFMLGFFIPFIILGVLFLGGAIFIIYGLVGAVLTFQGKDFRYFVIGNRLASYLEKND